MTLRDKMGCDVCLSAEGMDAVYMNKSGIARVKKGEYCRRNECEDKRLLIIRLSPFGTLLTGCYHPLCFVKFIQMRESNISKYERRFFYCSGSICFKCILF